MAAARLPRLRLLLTAIILCWLLFTVFLLLGGRWRGRGPLESEPETLNRAIVTLSSTGSRLRQELPLVLDSLLRQTVPAREIRLHFPQRDRDMVVRPGTPQLAAGGGGGEALASWEDPSTFLPGVPAAMRHPSVKVAFVPDRGPASKFLYSIRELILASPNDVVASSTDAAQSVPASTPLVVCDDDHYYQPRLLETLLAAPASLPPDSAAGFRGWRIREDLEWGVPPGRELSLHVVEGHRIAEPYQVGIITANEGYLVFPRFFLNASGGAPILTPVSSTAGAPPEAAFVDDIWMNGHLAARGIRRYVIPTPCQSLDITVSHTLEAAMDERSVRRAQANTATLRFFRHVWDPKLWYRFGGVNGPRAAHPATLALRVLRNLRLRVFMLIIKLITHLRRPES